MDLEAAHLRPLVLKKDAANSDTDQPRAACSSELEVAAYEAPTPDLEEGLRICVDRLGGNPEDGVDLEPGEIAVAVKAGGAVVGGGTYKHVPHGLWVCALGCLERRGGGTAFFQHALGVAQKKRAAFLALRPLDKSAAEFWARAGFSPMRCGWYALRFCPHRRAAMLHDLAVASSGRLDDSALEEVAELFASEASAMHCIWVLWL